MTRKEFENLELEKTFIYDDKKLQVKEAKTHWDCVGCYFYGRNCITATLPYCHKGMRKDKKSVIFKEMQNGKN